LPRTIIFPKPPGETAQLERVLSPRVGLIRRYAGASPLGVVNTARIYGCRNRKFTMHGRAAASRRSSLQRTII
jgi:hypothetical protein